MPPKIIGVHRVPARLAGGKRVVYHYAFRGGQRFWIEPTDGPAGSAEYLEALVAARKSPQPVAARNRSIERLVAAYQNSGEFKRLAPRTQADYKKWSDRFADRFGEAPAVLLEDRRFREDAMKWRDEWSHSPKQAWYAWTVAKLVASWAFDHGIIGQHVITGGTAIYKADRAEIVWPPEEVSKLCAIAPEWVRRIVLAAVNTGMRPQDLCKLSRSHVKPDAIQMRTQKRSRMASIPILPEMRQVLDETPADRLLILASERGKPLTPHRASEGVRQWARKASCPDELRLQDMRGTAATRLVRAGVDLDDVAVAMGWSLRYARQVIDNYVALDPSAAAEIAQKVVDWERKRNAKV